jgi:O-antigen/teichoic acid export membrane protein
VTLWPTIFSGIGLFGVNISLARRAAITNNPTAVTRAAILTTLITSIITCVVGYFILPYFLPANCCHLLWMVNLFLLYIPLSHLAINLLAVNQGLENYKLFNTARMSFYVVNLSCILLFWLTNSSNIFYFILAILAGNIAVILMQLLPTFQEQSIAGPSESIRRILHDSIPFGFANIGTIIYHQIDKILLLWLLGALDLGSYMVALSSASLLSSVTTSIGIVIFSISAHNSTHTGFSDIAKVFRRVTVIWLICGPCWGFLQPIILPLVFGSEFANATYPAMILIAGIAAGGLASLLEQSLRGQGHPFFGLSGNFISLGIMVATGYLLTPVFNIAGICIGYIAGQISFLGVMIVSSIIHYHGAKLSTLIPTIIDFQETGRELIHLLTKLYSRYTKKENIDDPE